MKISILTPTYNDAESIMETYASLKNQTYTDWEWIIINDGSTDNTKDILEEISQKEPDGKIIWKTQENADQLNAIINGVQYISGDYVFILHTDDLLPSDDFFEKCITYMSENSSVDGIFGDLCLIDDNSNSIGMQSVKNYIPSNSIPPLQLLWLGRNLYCDVAFHKTDYFKTQVFKNYLTWNTPFWLNFEEDGVSMLNYRKVDFPILKYRVHSGNYINNELGKLNVINGELRTALKLMQFYHIPLYSLQYFIFRVFNRLKLNYIPLYKNKETSNKSSVIEFIIKKRYDSVSDNQYLNSLYNFYKSNSSRTLILDKLPEDLPIYYGKDIRAFNKKLLENQLEEFYINFMEEMNNGFSEIAVKNPDDINKVKDITEFLGIFNINIKSF